MTRVRGRDRYQRLRNESCSDLPRLGGKELRQDVSDTMKRAVGKERTPPKGKPNPHRAGGA